ncbi:MAG: thioredoxin family protein [Pseudomonadota bacterium]
MKLQQRYMRVLIILFICFLSGCMTTDKTPDRLEDQALNSPNQATQNAEIERIKKKIAEAIQEAKRTGKTSVDVFLDEDPGTVQTKDLVKVRYTARLEDGRTLSGTGSIAEAGAKVRSLLTLVAGDRTIIPGLGNAVLDMKAHEKKTVTLVPENAFGIRTREKTQTFPLVRTIPKVISITADEYEKRFNTRPREGDPVIITPYFKSEIIKVVQDHVLVRNLARDGYSEQAPFGKTTISLAGDDIIVTLLPYIGAVFETGSRKGIIVSRGTDDFVVDYNHPFAGQTLQLDLEIVSLTKASVFRDIKIPWIDDHDRGMDIARETQKNKVLVLYADWCQWCEKLFKETFMDPRIKLLKDDFVWVKANSDEDQSLKSFYQQDGFPMIVLTDCTGNIIKKLDGFKDADHLLNELEQVMALKKSAADN